MIRILTRDFFSPSSAELSESLRFPPRLVVLACHQDGAKGETATSTSTLSASPGFAPLALACVNESK